jgi:hypothetical protein
MHRRDAQRLANLLLRQRHFERVTDSSARDGKARAQFNNDMASRLHAGRCPTLTIHSRNIAESINVSRQSTSAMFGLPASALATTCD